MSGERDANGVWPDVKRALLDPGTVAKIYASLTKRMQEAQQSGLHPIVLTSPGTRLGTRSWSAPTTTSRRS